MATAAKKKAKGKKAGTSAAEILEADRAAILRKVQEGKTLTAAEWTRIQAEASGVDDDVETYVENLSDLAKVLGISRVALNTWRQMSGAPRADSAGRHNTAAWLKFRDERGLKGSETSSELVARQRILDLKIENEEFDLAVKREQYTENEIFIQEISELGTEQKKFLRQKLESELPKKLAGKDEAFIRAEMGAIVDAVCEQMERLVGKWTI